MTNEEFQQLWRHDKLKEVDEEIDDSWRHGNHMWTTYLYEGRYWEAAYSVTGDGEEHGLRNGDFELREVFPVTKIVKTVEYVAKPPAPVSPSRYRHAVIDVEAKQFPGLPAVDLNTGDVDEEAFDRLEEFSDWTDVNAKGLTLIYRGDKLIIDDQAYPVGTWIVKEVGRPAYPLTNETFKEFFEKV